MMRWCVLAYAVQAVALVSFLDRSPNDEEYQDYIDDHWEKGHVGFSVPTGGRLRRQMGAVPSWCSRSRYAVPGPEDRQAGNIQCGDNHTLYKREFSKSHCANPFGKQLRTCTGSSCSFYWLEIPSSGASTLRSMLHPYFYEGSTAFSALTEKEVEGMRAFAFLRHPVTRFVGVYDNVVNYLTKVPPEDTSCIADPLRQVLALQEPERFQRFVDLFTLQGHHFIDLYPCAENPCLLFGVLSQTWFLNLWPGPVDFMGHVESADSDTEGLGNFLGVELMLPMRKRRKDVRGRQSTSLEGCLNDTGSIQKLHDYFHDEIRLHGYSPLPGFV